METVDFRAAKAPLSPPVDKAASRENAVLRRNGKPVAVLYSRQEDTYRPAMFGLLEGTVTNKPDFCAPLTKQMRPEFDRR